MNIVEFTAPVIHGRHLGHALGAPTINQLPPEAFAALPRGVYFARCEIDGIAYPAVSNLGVKPTVQDACALICETHILCLRRDLYGQNVRTELVHYRRPEQKFSSVAELSCALEDDIKAAKEYFGL